MEHYDALVIGAGPAGSRAAHQLALQGYRTAVFEKSGTIGNKPCCTGIIGRECVDLFDIGSDCILQEANSAKLFAPSGEFIRIGKEEPQAYIVDRAAFDQSLAKKAKNAGAAYLLSSNVRSISISPSGVELSVNQQGDTNTFHGKAVIIANGFGSKLPSKLGMGQIKNLITGAQVEVETNGIEEVEVYFSHQIAPGFFAWLAPISKHQARIGLFAKENPGKYLKQLLTKLASEGKISSTEATIFYGGIPLKPLPRTCSERALVIGDAAGQVKPTTGGGIYYGLLCADFAAETLHRAFQSDDFSKKNLSQYEKLWKAKLGSELRIDYFARRLYNRLSDKRINTMFNIVRDNNIHEKILESSYKSFDWHGELVLDGLKQMGPWRHLFGTHLPNYILRSLRGKS